VSEGQDVQNSNWWKTNQGAGLIAVGFFSFILGYIFFYTDYDRVLRDGFLLGFFSDFGVLSLHRVLRHHDV